MHTLILLAAGSGSRMQGCVADKILAPLHGRPVFAHSLSVFIESGVVGKIVIVYRDEAQRTALQQSVADVDTSDLPVLWVQGGAERQDSVLHALEAASPCEYVYIHDGARPLITVSALSAIRDAVQRDGAAVLAHPIVDTVKRIQDPNNLTLIELEDLDRRRLWGMETPQAFRYATILESYRHVKAAGLSITDDTAAAGTLGYRSTIVPNAHPNPKITTSADLAYIEWLLQNEAVTS